MDIVTLGLKVENDPVDKASDSLDRLSASAEKADKSSTGMGRSADRAGKQASAANEKASQSAKKLERSYTDVSKAVLSTAKSMLIIVGASLGASAIVNTLANFEQSMASVAAVTRASAEEMTALRNVAKELGATTEFSASQAAEALTFLGMAGFSAAESMAAIPSVLNLATAASLDLASAADITSNIMSGFGISAANAANVADVLAAASSRSNTSVSQLGQAMSTVAPIAGALDISLADTAAAIGVLSDAGIQSGRAGTALRGVLAALSKPTKEATTALKGLGLSASQVNPDTNELADVLDRLQKAGLGTADAMTIFGREAASGALVLVGAAGRVREFGAELTDVTGDAQLMADIMRDNLKGDLLGVTSAIEGLIIALGEAGITSVLRVVAQSITTAVRSTSGFVDVLGRVGQAITGYLQPAFEAVKQYSDIAVAALAGFYAPVVLGGFVALTAAVRSLTVSLAVGLVGAIRAVTVAMLANPVGLIISALAAAAVAAYQFSTRFREFVGEDVVGVARTAANYVIGSFVAAYEDIKFVWSNFGDIMGGSVVGGVNVAIRAINRLIQGSLSGINSLIDAVNEIPGIDIGRIGQNAGIEELANPYAERLTASVEERNKKIAEALSKDYFGGAAALFSGGDAPDVPETLDVDKITSGALGGGKASKELKQNIQAIKSLEQALYLAGLKGEELAVAQARLSLNEYATQPQIDQVERLGSEIFKVQERMARINKFGEGADADKFILGNVSPLSGGQFDNQFARYQAEEEAEQERYQSQLDRLIEARELQIETQRSYDELEAEAAQTHANRLAQIDQARSTLAITTSGNMFGTLANILKSAGKEQSALYKALFLAQQAAAIANAIVSTEEGAAKALGMGPLGIPLSTLIRASGYASVAAIAAQTITGMAHDGIDSVPQTGTWLLEKGERVTTANTSAKMDSVLERIDSSMRSNRTSGTAAAQDTPKVTVNIQNAPDGTRVEQRQLDEEFVIDVIMNDVNTDGEFSRYGQDTFGWVRQGT